MSRFCVVLLTHVPILSSAAGIIGPLLKMTLVPDVELRKSALPVFFDLLEFEYRNRGHFKQVRELTEDVHNALVP